MTDKSPMATFVGFKNVIRNLDRSPGRIVLGVNSFTTPKLLCTVKLVVAWPAFVDP